VTGALTLVVIDREDVDTLGFLCKKSRRASEGWQAKRSWFDRAEATGLRTWMALLDGRQVGFLEAATAETSWRVQEDCGPELARVVVDFMG